MTVDEPADDAPSADAREDPDSDSPQEEARRGKREAIVDEMEQRLANLLDEAPSPDRERRKTVDEVFDEAALLTLYKLMSHGHVDSIDYPVSTGKEANVFHGTTPGGESVAVKIFRVNTATFRSFMTYIHGDPRFREVGPNRRDVVHAWAQKEFKNLHRYVDADATVPRPLAHEKNVLLMEFVGEGGTPAPLLKDAPPEDPDAAYEAIVADVHRGLRDARLVHGDLSEFNVLNHHDDGGEPRLFLIDVAQSVLLDHPMSGELLRRDAKNLATFFRRRGLDVTPEGTLESFTEDLDDDELLTLGVAR